MPGDLSEPRVLAARSAAAQWTASAARAFACLALLLCGASVAQADWRFEVGQTLQYRVTIAPDVEGSTSGVGNADSSRRDAARSAVALDLTLVCLSVAEERSEMLLWWYPARDAAPDGGWGAGVKLLAFSVARDGTPEVLTRVPTPRVDWSRLLIPLTRSVLQSDATRSWGPDVRGRRWTYRWPAEAAFGASEEIEVGTERMLGFAQTRLRDLSGTVTLRRSDHRVTRFDLWQSEVAGGVRIQGRLTATGRQRVTWCAQRISELARYRDALESMAQRAERILHHPEQVESLIEQRIRLWQGLLADLGAVQESPVAAAARDVAATVSDARGWRSRAQRARRWLDRPARPWTLMTLDGATLESEQVRQGDSIEVFWRSGSISSLSVARQAGMQLRELVRRGAVRLVLIDLDAGPIGTRPFDAPPPRGVYEVRGGALGSIEPLDEVPAVRWIDSRGVVRRVWFGPPDRFARWIDEVVTELQAGA